MTICKFFLQGTCKFGDSCKFEHQMSSDHNYGTSSSILLQNYASKPAPATSNVDTNTLVKSVVNDMTAAEKGGQWLLSSYAPFKEKPAFPGFEDCSMEEVRFQFYEAMRSGALEQFKQNLQIMLQQAVMKIKALQNPSPDAVNMLKMIYNTTPSSSLSNNQTPFNAAQSNTIFGNPAPQQKSAFGGPQPGPVFAAATPTPAVFSGVNQPQPNMFGGGATSVFAPGQNIANSTFAPLHAANPPKSIFGNPQQPASNSVFGGNPVLTQQPAFANQPHTQQYATAAPFNQQPQFTQPPQQNIFHQNASNQFGNLQPSNNQFAAHQFTNPQALTGGNKPAFQHSANIFGNLGMQNLNPTMAAQAKPREEFYSKLEELTEDEIKWFQSNDLDIDNIPEKPPTYEMCFQLQ